MNPLFLPCKATGSQAMYFHALSGYAAFAVSFGFALLYLLKNKAGENSSFTSMIPELTVLEQLIYRTAVLGLIF